MGGLHAAVLSHCMDQNDSEHESEEEAEEDAEPTYAYDPATKRIMPTKPVMPQRAAPVDP